MPEDTAQGRRPEARRSILGWDQGTRGTRGTRQEPSSGSAHRAPPSSPDACVCGGLAPHHPL